MYKRIFLTFTVAQLLAAGLRAEAPTKLEVGKDTHIAIMGNALADRMQHDGTLEAMIHKAHPQDDISIRNLGFAADEITSRVRSEGVPSQDDWLNKAKADVILAFWGYNESFKGAGGLEKFKSDLNKYLTSFRAKAYNGKSAPRLVLFSPIAQEKQVDANLPDPTENNANLQLYTAAMAEVAKACDVQFIDLFGPSQELYKKAKQPLTHNGIHLTVAGYQALAPVIYEALFGAKPPATDAGLQKIRAAVQVKNDMWESRYRTVDQYNIYGGRSKAPTTYENGKGGPKIANEDVMHPEMAVRDVMTENREKRVWALAKGSDLKIDDSNVPEVPQIKTNKPGPNPDGSYKFVGAEEAIKLMTVPKGVKVELVASEEQFPELVSPVQMAWDTKGRLWVSAWKNYPERTPWSTDGDKLLVFDIGADGKAKKCTTFLDDLNCPTGFQFYKDGVFVMKSPELLYVRDTNGDGKGEIVERVLNGLDAADSHHETNSMAIEPGGAIYLSDGVFHRTQIETANGPVRNRDGGIYRWEPRTGEFERYIAFGFANPHGKVFDYWGNDIITDATGNNNFFGSAFSGHTDTSHPGMDEFWKRPSRPCAGTGILSSRAWPEDFNGNFLNCNVIGVQGIFRVKVNEQGSGIRGETLENLVTSSDPNFRPSGVTVAPDGSVYFMDWHKPLIGHLQHHLRDPNREQAHGRIYRLTFEGMALLKPAKIAGEPIEKLLELLKEPENNTRERAKIELGGRDTAQVMAAVDKWIDGLNKSEATYDHNVLEGLWVKQYHNVVDPGLIKRVLLSSDPRARAQAARVLCYQRDRVPDVLALLKTAAEDESPRVRLEAVRAASFFNGKDVSAAFDVAFSILKHDTDYYLDYVFKETLKQLGSLGRGVSLPQDPAILAKYIGRMSDADLAKAPSSEPVLYARLERKSTSGEQRERAIAELARLHNTDRGTELVAVLQRFDSKGGPAVDELGKILGTLDAKTLAPARPGLVTLSEKATQESVRRAAWAAVLSADGNPAVSWPSAKTDDARIALLAALGNMPDVTVRAKLQPTLVATLSDAKTSATLRGAALKALPLMGPDFAKANFVTLAAHIQRGLERAAATRAITQLPQEAWEKTQAGPVTASIVNWARTVPTDKRTAQEFIETVQFGDQLAALLPEADAAKVRKELRALGVSVFVVKTVREQMRYDTPQITVEAGKPFEIIFENVDAMGHNLVIVEPGARQAVAEAVQTMKPDQVDRKGRAYVPVNDKRVLEATKIVEPGQKEVLKMTAPLVPGDYEFVCTYPGHWQIMWGKLTVVKDLDAPAAVKPADSAKASNPQ
jgi:azurin/glucose/arabinose dehydrogenase/lysophospholipase L1-like esterase